MSGTEMAACLLLHSEMSSLDSLCSNICYKQSGNAGKQLKTTHARPRGVEQRSPRQFLDRLSDCASAERVER